MTKKKRILVVDDESALREALSATLTGKGYAVSSADGGEIAIEMLRTKRFDLLVLDLNMPKVDGYEVLSYAKKKHPTTKVIMLTGFADLNNARDSRGLGADLFLNKPIELRDLHSAVRRVLGDT